VNEAEATHKNTRAPFFDLLSWVSNKVKMIMKKITDVKSLLEKVEEVTRQKELDLSSGEDLSIGIMNLISIEEHLFYTSQKTKDKKYLDLLDEVRRIRTDLLKDIIKDYEGEVWCISKHLLAASMRIMEVGTKELKKAAGAEPAEAEKHKDKAWELFDKSYKLYSLFWGLNLGVVGTKDVTRKTKDKEEIQFTNDLMTNDQRLKTEKESVFSKLGALVQKAVDCCKE